MPPDVAPGLTSSNCALVFKEIKRLEAFFAGKAAPTQPKGTLLPRKRWRKVGFKDNTVSHNANPSNRPTIISIGSELEPDFAEDADGPDLCDVPPLSA